MSLRKISQNITRDSYRFVPLVPFDRIWSDALLYERYGLTSDEIAFIESQVVEHEGTLFDEQDEQADE